MPPLMQSHLPGWPVRRGKVRDVYDLGEKLLIVASDRLSAFDVVLPTPIPDKGVILTGLSNFWFRWLDGEVSHHLLASRVEDFPAELEPFAAQLRGRAVLVRKTKVIPVECVVRGYLAGGGWKEYQQSGTVSGVRLPVGLRLSEQLAEPIFTPSTKAATGHDESITWQQAAERVGRAVMEFVRAQSLRIYRRAAEMALARGIIIADTKFEWGLPPGAEQPILIDEVLTPDSSRFWPKDRYKPGVESASFDKQYVRNYLETLAWTKRPPGPALPPEVVENTRRRYIEAYERLSGLPFRSPEA
jgi:phosphoribosylaminoimidazole-succinocarboxamide synthase